MARTPRALPARPRAAREGAAAGTRHGHDALRGVLHQRAAAGEPAPAGGDVHARAAPADPPQGDGRACAPALAHERRALAAEPEGAQWVAGVEPCECAPADEPDVAGAGAGEAAATDVDAEQEVVIVRTVLTSPFCSSLLIPTLVLSVATHCSSNSPTRIWQRGGGVCFV